MFKKCWLLVTDLHSDLRGKMFPVFEDAFEERNAKLCAEFSGVFSNDSSDKPVPNLASADPSVNIIAIPNSTIVESPFDVDESFQFCNALVKSPIGLIQPSVVCPRTLLFNAMRELKELGFKVKCGAELEWTFLKQSTYSSQDKSQKSNLAFEYTSTYSMSSFGNKELMKMYDEILYKKDKFPVQIECIHSECGHSMFEAALSPSNPLDVADAVQLYRLCIKRTAQDNGFQASFSPKILSNSAGTGCHFHLSLIKTDRDEPCQDVLYDSFLAGLMHHMESSSLLLLPNIDSYLRIHSDGFWTSNKVSFGDSRYDSIRLVHPEDRKEARLELRTTGSDANPYLALYFCIKAGMYGIKNDLKIKDYKNGQLLPKNVQEAYELFTKEGSPSYQIYKDSFIRHYGTLRLHEATQSARL